MNPQTMLRRDRNAPNHLFQVLSRAPCQLEIIIAATEIKKHAIPVLSIDAGTKGTMYDASKLPTNSHGRSLITNPHKTICRRFCAKAADADVKTIQLKEVAIATMSMLESSNLLVAS